MKNPSNKNNASSIAPSSPRDLRLLGEVTAREIEDSAAAKKRSPRRHKRHATVVVVVVIVVEPAEPRTFDFRGEKNDEREGRKEERSAVRFNVFVISANSLAARENAFVTDKRGPQCVN